MSNDPSAGAAIQCTPKELRDLHKYVQSLEKELHQKKQQLAHVRAARSLRVARALGQLRRTPWSALRELGRALRGGRAATVPTAQALKHRSFEVFRRGAVAPSMRDAAQVTVLAEVATHCGLPAVVTLRGCDPGPLPTVPAERRHDVGPDDFELLLAGLLRPWLLIDLRRVDPDSRWAGVLGVDDMRLNLALANLIELVHSLQGRVVFARMDPSLSPPLLADFQSGATQVDHFDSFDPDTLSFE